MCGIAGIYAFGSSAPPVDRSELLAIRDHMAARGPDGFGEWYSADKRVGLGHRRLAIIDLNERSAQPMTSADGQLVITFNGEIYNYRELKRTLEAKGYVFRTESDTEVLLHLYADKGEAMLQDLRGMFAFGLWDGRKRAMLLARDAFGIKPLYYANSKGTLRFASQVKALLLADVDTSPEPAGHAGFFLWGSVPAPWTLYKGIHNLKAGHFCWASQQGVSAPVQFSAVNKILAEAAGSPATGSRADAMDVLTQSLRQSIAAHQIADVPVGLFLSAGLDSAMITAAATAGGARPNTLTLCFAEYVGTPNDEAPMAERLAATLGTRHATLMVRREDFQDERAKLMAAMDQPSIDGVNTWFVAKAAASQGIKVALSGLGGDELLASYPSFAELPRITRLTRPFARIPGFGKAVRLFSAPMISRMTSPKYAGLLEYGGTLDGAYLLRRGLYMPWELPEVMSPDLAREGWRQLQASSEHANTSAGITSERLAISSLEMSGYMRHQLLRDTDWASMAHSLEIRVPFVDIPLLQTVAPWLAAHPDITKPEIAAALAPQLPEALLKKPKTGFSVPVREWLGVAEDKTERPQRGLRGWAQAIYKNFGQQAA